MTTVMLRDCAECDGESDTFCVACTNPQQRQWYIDESRDNSDWDAIPFTTRDALRQYVALRQPPGGFLIAVLSNNLTQAVARGDSANIAALPQLVTWLNNHMPSTIWGSWSNYTNWASSDAR